ncbi:MAG TPA: glycosyltransferase [Burkholderiales bacterium]|nr:glycosyltransferase [Burkholderiales bacterium]
MKIIYSFNKTGFEADYWTREIAAASSGAFTFVPFNHGEFLDLRFYLRAQLLDNAYYEQHPYLLRLYDELKRRIRSIGADVLLVDTGQPYHPEFLRTLDVYKVLRTTDGPMTAYDRDFAYVHAFDHVLYHSPAYSRDMGMEEKLYYVGARRADFWPLALFDAMHETSKTEETILAHQRDIDVIFVGGMYPNKMGLLARVKKAFGKHFVMRGLTNWRRNLYFNARFGFPGWVRPIRFEDYVPLYQRSKIGINIHNRGKYTVGSYRLFDLPGNGVMQISDGDEYLSSFYDVPAEIETYSSPDDLIDKIKHYVANDAARDRIALAGFQRVKREHRFAISAVRAAGLIARGMKQPAARDRVAATRDSRNGALSPDHEPASVSARSASTP